MADEGSGKPTDQAVNIVLAEYLWNREEEAHAQTAVVALTSIVVLLESGVAGVLTRYSSVLTHPSNYCNHPSDSGLPYLMWVALPLPALGICGWIAFLGFQALVRRQLLLLEEGWLADQAKASVPLEVLKRYDRRRTTRGPISGRRPEWSEAQEAISLPFGTRALQGVTRGSGSSIAATGIMFAGAFLFALLSVSTTIFSLMAARASADCQNNLVIYVAIGLYSIFLSALVFVLFHVAGGSTKHWRRITGERAVARDTQMDKAGLGKEEPPGG